jgi:uncharacterized protein involved in outer membrane biogenesis
VVLIGIALVLVIAVVSVRVFLDKAIRAGVEKFGPPLTQTTVRLEGAHISPFSGSGLIQGFELGNPAGYKTPYAIRVGSAALALQPSSLWSDKIVIRSIRLEGPEITFEGDLSGNNLSQIMKNVQAATGGAGSKPSSGGGSGPGKKLEVDEFVLTGGKVHLSTSLLGGKSATIALPDIQLTQLGTGPDGITAAELTHRLLGSITDGTLAAVRDALAKGLKNELGNALGTNAPTANEIKGATKSVTDLFKKK